MFTIAGSNALDDRLFSLINAKPAVCSPLGAAKMMGSEAHQSSSNKVPLTVGSIPGTAGLSSDLLSSAK
jgi:hypothetical protein